MEACEPPRGEENGMSSCRSEGFRDAATMFAGAGACVHVYGDQAVGHSKANKLKVPAV